MAKKKATKTSQSKIIRNMGLFWKRDEVLWKGDRKVGPKSLLGQRAGAKRAGNVDFWRQVGVYALYADYHLVYVGQAGIGDKACIGTRLKKHTKDDLAGRWDMFSWFGLCKVKANLTLGARFGLAKATWNGIADILEGILIEVAEPPMNSQKGRFGKGVHRYLQAPLPREKFDIAAEVRSLANQLTKIQKKVGKKK